MGRTKFISSNFFLLLITFIFLCIFFYSNKIYAAYDCYAAGNAGSVAPSDAPAACANKYIVPSTSGGGQ